MFAYFVAAVAPSMDVANTMLTVYVTICLFFAGLLMNFDTMPQYWKWFSCAQLPRLAARAPCAPADACCPAADVDVFRYAWGALMVNQYGDSDPQYLGGQGILEHFQVRSRRAAALP